MAVIKIIEMGFPVFCRGTCMRGTVKNTLSLINHPIVFGEVVVNPGDLVIGDDDGIVIIPQGKMKDVLEAGRQRVIKEEDKASSLSRGNTSVELNTLDEVFQRFGLIEE